LTFKRKNHATSTLENGHSYLAGHLSDHHDRTLAAYAIHCQFSTSAQNIVSHLSCGTDYGVYHVAFSIKTIGQLAEKIT
jgi:hypothetical protein